MSERRAKPVAAPDVAAGWPEPPILRLDRGRALKAFDWGALAGLVVALAYGLLWAVFELHLGLIAVGVMGGWLIGAAVTHGAWHGSLHIPDRRLRILAAAIAAGSWLVGAFVAYFTSQALFPNPTTDLLQRLSFGGFSEYLISLVDIVHGIALLALVAIAWRSTR